MRLRYWHVVAIGLLGSLVTLVPAAFVLAFPLVAFALTLKAFHVVWFTSTPASYVVLANTALLISLVLRESDRG